MYRSDEHTYEATNVGRSQACLLAERQKNGSLGCAGQVAVEGRITAKFDMQPRAVDAAYHRLFQDRVIKATSKTRYSQVRHACRLFEATFC